MAQAEPPSLADQMRDAPLEHLAGVIAGTDPGSRASEAAKAELTRRQILAEQGTAQAQVDAARYTKENARWMFWSVIALVVSSLANLAWQVVTHFGSVCLPH
jgi:hypothetical protein